MAVTRRIAALSVGLWLIVGCSSGEASSQQTVLRLSLPVNALGVAGVGITISCLDGTQVSEYVALEAQGLPRHVDPDLAGQVFSDLFTVLPVGVCVVTATPMVGPQQAAEHCQTASVTVTLQATTTTEVLLAMQCKAAQDGPIDVIATLNHAPAFLSVTYSPDQIVPVNTPVTLEVSAFDPDDDALTYQTGVTGPPGAVFEYSAVAATVTLLASTPGAYVVAVTADDGQLSTEEHFGVTVTSTDP
jgi:hypothetical protein